MSNYLDILKKFPLLTEKTSKEDLTLAFQFALKYLIKLAEEHNVKIEGLNKLKGRDGTDGKTPTPDELVRLMKPLIPSPIPGKDGKTGPMGPRGERGAGKDGRDGIDGRDGKDAFLDEKKLEDRLLSTLLGRLPNWEDLFKEEIDKLKKEVDDKISRIPRGKTYMGRIPMIRAIDLTDQVNGSATTFTLPRDTVRVLFVWSTQFPVVFNSSDFSLTGQTLSLGSGIGVIQSGQSLTALVETLFYA